MVQQVLSCCESIDSDLCVFLNSSEDHYYIYLGVALLEKVSIDPSDLRHKMLIGRLYNGGAKLSVLQERFNHDPRTIKRWAQAILSNDPEEICLAFAGRSGQTKATPELVQICTTTIQKPLRSGAELSSGYHS